MVTAPERDPHRLLQRDEVVPDQPPWQIQSTERWRSRRRSLSSSDQMPGPGTLSSHPTHAADTSNHDTAGTRDKKLLRLIYLMIHATERELPSHVAAAAAQVWRHEKGEGQRSWSKQRIRKTKSSGRRRRLLVVSRAGLHEKK
ncbi:hypothetical protein BHM03_00031964 [Ensete ventricosum]|nr:hypothetical protein BHM03_00031964 [Ensete ventricosum]